jgi:hypothetical protein
MGQVITEGKHTGHFIIDVEGGPGALSFEEVTVAAGNVMEAGDIVSMSGTDVVPFAGGAAVGILYSSVNAADGPMKGVIVARDAAVVKAALGVPSGVDIETAIPDLVALHIVCR